MRWLFGARGAADGGLEDGEAAVAYLEAARPRGAPFGEVDGGWEEADVGAGSTLEAGADGASGGGAVARAAMGSGPEAGAGCGSSG